MKRMMTALVAVIAVAAITATAEPIRSRSTGKVHRLGGGGSLVQPRERKSTLELYREKLLADIAKHEKAIEAIEIKLARVEAAIAAEQQAAE